MLAATQATQPRTLLVAFTLVNVCMQLGSAFLLKIAPEPDRGTLFQVALILCGVLGLNVIRFLVWGKLHKRFPISLAYPASALFFPGVLAMAWWFGEHVGVAQIIGCCLVLAGVALLLAREDQP